MYPYGYTYKLYLTEIKQLQSGNKAKHLFCSTFSFHYNLQCCSALCPPLTVLQPPRSDKTAAAAASTLMPFAAARGSQVRRLPLEGRRAAKRLPLPSRPS